MNNFHCKIQTHPDHFFICVNGSLDLNSRDDFKNIMEALLSETKNNSSRFVEGEGSTTVTPAIIDCGNLSFIDSSGLGTLLLLYSKFLTCSLPMQLINVPVKIQELLEITQISRYIRIFKCREDALRNLNDSLLSSVDQSPDELSQQVGSYCALPTSHEPTAQTIVNQFELNVPVRKGVARLTSRYLMDLISIDYEVSEEDYDKISLAVDEALNNSIEHGYSMVLESERRESKNIKVFAFCYGDRIVIAVEDYGTGFNQEQVQERYSEMVQKENFSWRGRGIYLMNKLVDGIAFDSRPNQGSVFFLMKKLQRRLVVNSSQEFY